MDTKVIDVRNLSKKQIWGQRIIALSMWVLPLTGSALSITKDFPLGNRPIVQRIVEFGQDNAIWGFVLFFIFLAAGKYLSRPGNPKIWTAIQRHLDVMQEIACPQQCGDFNDNHRVTLFRRKTFSIARYKTSPKRWPVLIKSGQHPWSGWLVPVLRSGHTNKNTKTIFWAPDDGKAAEGIAGYCWASDDVEQVYKLPSLSKTSGSRNKTKYADRTKMTEELVDDYLKRGKDLPRSLMGFPLKTSEFEPWGVIVIDSMNAEGIDFGAADEAFRAVAAPMSVLLEEL